MSVRRLLAATAVALLGGFALAAPAAAQVSIADGGGSGRAGSVVALGLALIGVVVGAWALRSAGRVGTGNGQVGAFAALGLALLGMVVGVVALTGSDGGVGTGNGRGGAIVALVLALIGMVVGGLALARSRRTA